MEGGFESAYPPPGEVGGLRFIDSLTLEWDPEPSAGFYNVYRDLQSTLPGDFGICGEQDLPDATAMDLTPPPPVGEAYYYLATAKNRLGEEGTKGFRSSGAEKPTSSSRSPSTGLANNSVQ